MFCLPNLNASSQILGHFPFGGVHSSFINNKHNPSLMYVGLDQPQRHPVDGVELASFLFFLSREAQEGLEIIQT